MSPARKIGLLVTAVLMLTGAYQAAADCSFLPLIFFALLSYPFATQGT